MRTISVKISSDFVTNFKPNEWGYNGPQLLTRVARDKVRHTTLAEMTPEKCRGLKVFPPEEFYAVNYDDYPYFFDVRFNEKVLQATESSSVIHVWYYFRSECLYSY